LRSSSKRFSKINIKKKRTSSHLRLRQYTEEEGKHLFSDRDHQNRRSAKHQGKRKTLSSHDKSLKEEEEDKPFQKKRRETNFPFKIKII